MTSFRASAAHHIEYHKKTNNTETSTQPKRAEIICVGIKKEFQRMANKLLIALKAHDYDQIYKGIKVEYREIEQ